LSHMLHGKRQNQPVCKLPLGEFKGIFNFLKIFKKSRDLVQNLELLGGFLWVWVGNPGYSRAVSEGGAYNSLLTVPSDWRKSWSGVRAAAAEWTMAGTGLIWRTKMKENRLVNVNSHVAVT
jgi:hypothetical protein